MKNKIINISIIGNALEYYDFTIFAIFSTQIGQCFFPSHNEAAQTLLALTIFAVGFLARPFGGLVFGHIGDRYGRKLAITTSIIAMALPTFLVGVLPGYEKLGILAPLLLLILRLVQGISIGGEGPGTAIFVMEHYHGKRAGFLGGVVTASYFLGSFVATMVGLLISFYEKFSILNWRDAFIFGGLIGFLGIYLRSTATETPIFKEVLKNKRNLEVPVMALLKESKQKMILTLLLGGICGAVAYVVIVYINIFLNKTIKLDAALSFLYSMISMSSCILFLPIFGYLSDKMNHEQFFKTACYVVIIFIVPLFMLISNNMLILPSVISLGVLSAWICAPAYAIMLKLFSVEQRYSGIGFSFNLGLALFGGTTPIIATFLTQKSGLTYSPALYLMALIIAFIGYDTIINKEIKIADSALQY